MTRTITIFRSFDPHRTSLWPLLTTKCIFRITYQCPSQDDLGYYHCRKPSGLIRAIDVDGDVDIATGEDGDEGEQIDLTEAYQMVSISSIYRLAACLEMMMERMCLKFRAAYA
jgi:hypothetical protein